MSKTVFRPAPPLNCLLLDATQSSFVAALDDKASMLATQSAKYKKDAHYLNLSSSYAKIAAIIVIIIVFLLFMRYWIF